MADVADNEELIATRKLHGLNDNLFKTEKEAINYCINVNRKDISSEF